MLLLVSPVAPMGIQAYESHATQKVAPTPMYVCCLLSAWLILSSKPKQKWFVSVYFNFVSEVNRSKEATIDTLFCTSYDSSPYSLMTISLKGSMIFLWLS